jgi:FkbM family methyltransferase
MGYVREKYSKAYFLKVDGKGVATKYGVEGAELFNKGAGEIRSADKQILDDIDFNNKVVLDFGFGRGEALKYAAEHGAKSLLGVDFAKLSYQIAAKFLKKHKIDAELFCMDALEFMDEILNNKKELKIDIILMLDFVEHVPRKELSTLLDKLLIHLSQKGILVINTPVFPVDNDVLVEGLKREAVDTSDLFPETAGMHCNRYTKESLSLYLKEHDLLCITGHIYCKKTDFINSKPVKKILDIFSKNGFPLKPNDILKDKFEYAGIPKQDEVKINAMYFPVWQKIKGGILKNRPFYIDTKDNNWQKEIIDGVFDKFFWDTLLKMNLKGKTFFDIGAHIGLHSMSFAELVGDKGMVYAFEPNKYNIQRLELILGRNSDLKERIQICNCAIGDKDSEVEFNFSSNIDNGKSSGSFIAGAITPYSAYAYKESGFKKIKVHSIKLDDVAKKLGITRKPDIIKIDIEGAENIALEGARELIKDCTPIFLIELHSLENILTTYEFFLQVDYKIDVLDYQNEHRVFIMASKCDSIGKAEFNEVLKSIKSYSLDSQKLSNNKYSNLNKAYQSLDIEYQKSMLKLENEVKQKEAEITLLNNEFINIRNDYNSLINSNPYKIYRRVKKIPGVQMLTQFVFRPIIKLYRVLKNA